MHALRRFEGPTCNIDINECVRGTDNCAADAACINTQGMPGGSLIDIWQSCMNCIAAVTSEINTRPTCIHHDAHAMARSLVLF